MNKFVQNKVDKARAIGNAGFNFAPFLGAVVMAIVAVTIMSGHVIVALVFLVAAVVVAVLFKL